jgi:hypothetical protein
MAKRIAADYQLDEYYESTPLLYRFYLDNPERFRERSVFDLRLLEKQFPADEAARAAIRDRLQAIADAQPDEPQFAQAVKENADEPIFRETGGLLEDVAWSDLSPSFRPFLLDAQPGQLLGPFEADGRLYLVYILSRVDDTIMPFEEERAYRRAAVLYESRVRENLKKDYFRRKLREVNARVNPALLGGSSEPNADNSAEPAADASAASLEEEKTP